MVEAGDESFAASSEWRVIGLSGRCGAGIGLARESIDGTCKLVGVGVGVEGGVSVADLRQVGVG